jgi:hypothetical protein
MWVCGVFLSFVGVLGKFNQMEKQREVKDGNQLKFDVNCAVAWFHLAKFSLSGKS